MLRASLAWTVVRASMIRRRRRHARGVSVHPDCEGGNHWIVEWLDSDGGCHHA
jgi:hypothetical protein